MTQTRRGAIAVTLATAAIAAAAPSPVSAADAPALTGHEHDWDWLIGHWNVHHRRLKARLVGNTEWQEFAGTCVMWPTLGGLGNVDDNLLELPAGTYRAMGVRAYDPKTNTWAIWWLDPRSPTIDPPVRGGFQDGIGTFIGDDVLNGRPIKVRFRWTAITATSAHWEQAFSPDGGASWEVNWTMQFTRAA
jgi:hypothetical protein